MDGELIRADGTVQDIVLKRTWRGLAFSVTVAELLEMAGGSPLGLVKRDENGRHVFEHAARERGGVIQVDIHYRPPGKVSGG
eukprot:gene10113-biopygen6172